MSNDAPEMTVQEYIDTRLDGQQHYFSKKSGINRQWYVFFKTVMIAIAVVIPFLTGLLKDEPGLKYTIGVLGVALALCNGLETFFKFHEKWITFRLTSEGLKQEKFLFLTRSGPYLNDPSLALLAERVELLIGKENSAWNQLMQEPKTKKNQRGG